MPKETSKKLLWCVLAISFSLLITVIVVGWMILKLEDTGTIATVVAAPIAVVTTCYSAKARSENILKIRKSIIEDNKNLNEHINDSDKEFISALDSQLTEIIQEQPEDNIIG